jgi:hypothetical protein
MGTRRTVARPRAALFLLLGAEPVTVPPCRDQKPGHIDITAWPIARLLHSRSRGWYQSGPGGSVAPGRCAIVVSLGDAPVTDTTTGGWWPDYDNARRQRDKRRRERG